MTETQKFIALRDYLKKLGRELETPGASLIRGDSWCYYDVESVKYLDDDTILYKVERYGFCALWFDNAKYVRNAAYLYDQIMAMEKRDKNLF